MAIKNQIRMVDVTVSTEIVKIGGWTPVATLSFTGSDNRPMIYEWAGQTLPKEMRKNTPECQHCNKIRSRKNVYVMVNEDGDYTQVGSSCVRDFIGYDPKAIAEAEMFQKALRDVGMADFDSDFELRRTEHPISRSGLVSHMRERVRARARVSLLQIRDRPSHQGSCLGTVQGRCSFWDERRGVQRVLPLRRSEED